MKSFFPIQVIDLGFEINQINPKQIHLFEEYRGSPNHVRLFIVPIKRRENKNISADRKVTVNKIKKKTLLIFFFLKKV